MAIQLVVVSLEVVLLPEVRAPYMVGPRFDSRAGEFFECFSGSNFSREGRNKWTSKKEWWLMVVLFFIDRWWLTFFFWCTQVT